MRQSGLILLLALLCTAVFAQDENPGVLMLHSYHPDFPWTAGIDSAATAELKIHYPHISIQKEFFDSKRYDTEKLESIFFSYLKKNTATLISTLFLAPMTMRSDFF